MKATLHCTRGLPASGKTTWAKDWVADDPAQRARLNRDDLRRAMFGRDYPLDPDKGVAYKMESALTLAHHAAVRRLLAGGVSVVVDDTMLRRKYATAWRDLARSSGADFHLVDFMHIGVDTCCLRDAMRAATAAGERFVGRKAIEAMAERYQGYTLDEPDAVASVQYVPNPALPEAWLVDIDGTLAHMEGRGPFEWHRVGEDAVDEAVRAATLALASGVHIIVLSGRDGSCEPLTRNWLEQHGIPYSLLLMRAAGDSRSDEIVKRELFDAHVAPTYNVVGVLDDRDRVVAMWRAMGLKCFQVAPGAF